MFVFNTYSSLLLPAVLQCLLFAGLTAWRYRSERRLSDVFLSLLLLSTGIKLSFWMLGFAGWYDSHDGYTTFMFYFPFSIYLLSGPLIYFYFRSLTNRDFKPGRSDWPHLVLPALYVLLIVGKFLADLILSYPFPKGADFQYGTRGPWAELDKSAVVNLVGFGSFFFYLLLILRAFPAYQKYIGQNFSDTEGLDFGWLRNMLVAIFAGITILFLFRVLELFTAGITYKTDWYGYAALALISYYVCINGYYIRSGQVYRLTYVAAEPVHAITVSADDEPWRQTLEQLMQDRQPYLQPELSLTGLAAMLGTNKTVLSRVINQYHGQNFNDFVNRYRVGQVISQIEMSRHRELTLLGIAYDSGFNSKATFNRAFKKVTGLTPQEYVSKDHLQRPPLPE